MGLLKNYMRACCKRCKKVVECLEFCSTDCARSARDHVKRKCREPKCGRLVDYHKSCVMVYCKYHLREHVVYTTIQLQKAKEQAYESMKRSSHNAVESEPEKKRAKVEATSGHGDNSTPGVDGIMEYISLAKPDAVEPTNNTPEWRYFNRTKYFNP